jgi:hypothetical protein
VSAGGLRPTFISIASRTLLSRVIGEPAGPIQWQAALLTVKATRVLYQSLNRHRTCCSVRQPDLNGPRVDADASSRLLSDVTRLFRRVDLFSTVER